MTPGRPAPNDLPSGPRLPAVVAAAGLSTRTGTPKALLDASGQTFLARVVAALSAGGCHPVLVVVRELSGPIADAARGCRAETILNPDPSSGPISSLQAGILALPEEAPGVVFTHVDRPLVQGTTVEALIHRFFAGKAQVVVPTHGSRRGHPVVFRNTLFDELTAGDLPDGARTVVRRYLDAMDEVPVDDAGVLVDIDTWEDYGRHFP